MGTRIFDDEKTILTTSDNLQLDDKFDNVSSKIYLSFAATNDANIYLSASEGFRSGGFNSPANAQAGSPISYGPEEVLTYELGAKASWLNNSLNSEVSVYYTDYSEFQAFFFDPLLFKSVQKNVGEAEIKGVEWDILMGYPFRV